LGENAWYKTKTSPFSVAYLLRFIHMQSFPRQKFTPPHNGGIIEKVALVLVALKEMSPFAMINVCARAVALFHSQPNKQPTQKHTRMHIRQGKTPVSYLPLFYDFIIKFRHIFWLAEISLLLNLTPAAAPAHIINPGKARARLSLYVQFQVRNNFLWHREEQECVYVCPVANLRVCISLPLRWCGNIKLFTCASHSGTTHTRRVCLLLAPKARAAMIEAFCRAPQNQFSVRLRPICAPSNLFIRQPGFSLASSAIRFEIFRRACTRDALLRKTKSDVNQIKYCRPAAATAWSIFHGERRPPLAS
jgi:hypothetical protein